jgi:hypothetical protein
MSLKRGERQTKFDPRIWMGVKMRRCYVYNGRRQAAPENKKPAAMAQTTFWRRHPEPFAKTWKGKLRRALRRFVLKQRMRHG